VRIKVAVSGSGSCSTDIVLAVMNMWFLLPDSYLVNCFALTDCNSKLFLLNLKRISNIVVGKLMIVVAPSLKVRTVLDHANTRQVNSIPD
jgi:hypothetical protein